MKPSAGFLLIALLGTAGLASTSADSWSTSLAKRGIEPSLVENPIAITPEIRAAADALSGRGGAERSTN